LNLFPAGNPIRFPIGITGHGQKIPGPENGEFCIGTCSSGYTTRYGVMLLLHRYAHALPDPDTQVKYPGPYPKHISTFPVEYQTGIL